MANTRKDRYETAAQKAILAMRNSLFGSGLTETEGMIVLRIVASQLEQVLKEYINVSKTP